MPAVIPLIGAGASVAAGWGGATALIGGTITAASVAGGLMVAGGALTAIGALTGNKSLMKWGGVLGLAGGVTKLTTAALEEAGKAAATSAAPASAAGGAAGQAAGSAASGAAQEASAGAQAMLADGTPSLGTGPDALAGTAAAPSAAPAGIVDSAAAPAASQAAAPLKGLVDSASAPQAIVDASQAAGPQGIVDASTPMGPQAIERAAGLPVDPAAPPGILDRVSAAGKGAASWVKDNKELVNTAAGLVQGAAKSYGDQAMLKERMKAQEQYEARQRARISASLKGLQMPQYVRPGGV